MSKTRLENSQPLEQPMTMTTMVFYPSATMSGFLINKRGRMVKKKSDLSFLPSSTWSTTAWPCMSDEKTTRNFFSVTRSTVKIMLSTFEKNISCLE